MNLGEGTLDQVLSNLKDYNPTGYELMGKISSALIPVALVIIAVLFCLEFSEVNKKLVQNNGQMSVDILVQIAWRYFAAFALVMLSGQIIDSILWLNSAIGHIINEIMPKSSNIEIKVPEIQGHLSWGQKQLINFMQGLANMTLWLAEIVMQVLVFLRFFQLFIYKAAAPILLATAISEEWRSISNGFVRRFIALIIQGFLLVLIAKLYPAIVANDMFDLVAKGNLLENLLAMFLPIVKSGVLIFVLLGSQNMARQWMGV